MRRSGFPAQGAAIPGMMRRIAIRLSNGQMTWLRQESRRTGTSIASLVRRQLEQAKERSEEKPFLRRAGAVAGPSDLSMRKGFSRR